jgi:hypothetical protein
MEGVINRSTIKAVVNNDVVKLYTGEAIRAEPAEKQEDRNMFGVGSWAFI